MTMTDETTISTSDMESKKMEHGENDVQNPWVLVAQKQVNKKRQSTEE